MRKNGPTRRSRRNPFARLWEAGSRSLAKAPRRRDVERLEERQMLTADLVASNPFFGQQWNLNATGQQTEFDPSSPTLLQTLATTDINVLDAWEQLATGLGVQIGIVSGGFDLNHEDLVGGFVQELAGNVLGGQAGLNTNVGFTSAADGNGTALSGIIGARNNDLGIVGIAYNADIIPIRAIADDGTVSTAAAETALRFRAGILLDDNGDGILNPDGDQVIDNDGDGVVDSFPANEVIDVYFVSSALNDGDLNSPDREFDPLDPAVEQALREGFNTGRSRWVDSNGDGLFSTDEIVSLGAIYVVPAGDDGGNVFGAQVENQGIRDSSQYDALASSRYTIAVGAVPYDGRYEDNAVGTVTSFSEIGANVLLVAPSGTNTVNLANPADNNLNSGILTTDITGEGGRNASPTSFPVVGEPNGDFFSDINYTSTFGGTEAAAAQVAAVIAQMLEVNPNLSNRDVEQILLQSAQTNDQFNETWINNAFRFFQGFLEFNPLVEGNITTAYTQPVFNRFALDTNNDGTIDIQNGVLPSSPILDPDFFQLVNQGILAGGGTLGVDFTNFVTGTDLTQVAGLGVFGGLLNEPIFSFGSAGNSLGVLTLDELYAPSDFQEIPLQFTNAAGFTVSHGYGQYIEEIGYAHGLLDAGLAVELARTWGELAISTGDSVTVTTSIESGLDVQAAARLPIAGSPDFIIPGGIGGGALNLDRLTQYTLPFTTANIDVNGANFGEVIVGGPFVDPNLNLAGTNRATSFRPITFDQGVGVENLSIEHIEVALTYTAPNVGDFDHLRIALVSPSGTVSELNQFSLDPFFGGDSILQGGQFGQGTPTPNGDGLRVIDSVFNNGRAITDINDGSEDIQITAIDQPDPIVPGTRVTLSTNRHYGETLNTEATNISNPAAPVTGQWYLAFENYGAFNFDFDDIQITFHGREATSQRIQGKIGVDDNAQGINSFNQPTQDGGATATNPTPEQLGDGVFNFDRFIEFGELIVDPNPFFDEAGFYIPSADSEIITVVLDDETDSIPLDELQSTVLDINGVEVRRDRVYRSIDPETGIETFVPIVNRDAYFSYDTDPTALGTLVDNLSEFDPEFADDFVNPALRKTDGQFNPGTQFGAVFGTFFGTRFQDGTISSYRNFDYSQESFAAGVQVEAVQYRVDYNAFGQASERVATGQVQRFVTGADGNYYFDVDATPAPPDIFADPFAYGEWFNDFGGTFEYEIRVVGQDERLFDKAFKPDQQEDPSAQVTFTGRGVYDVQLFADQDFQSGQTVKVEDLNFLLAVDLEEAGFNVSGTVIGAATNADGGATNTNLPGVTVFHDANNNGVFDSGEISEVTDANGAYNLLLFPLPATPNGAASTATIRVDTSTVPADFRVDGDAVVISQDVAGIEAGGSATGVDFVVRSRIAIVSGTVFQDLDEDGQFDTEETAFDGTTIGRDGVNPALFVYEDVDGNGVFDGADRAAPVDANGAYQLEFRNPGSATLRLDLTNADVSQTAPAAGGAIIVALNTNALGDIVSVSGQDFGVRDQRVFDFGDLPDSYGTTLAADGARHRVNNGNLYFGNVTPDLEFDGIPSVNADGDDNTSFPDDEDGVALVGVNLNGAGEVTELILEVAVVGGGGVLNAFIDFNNNGVFDADEQVVTDKANLITGVGTSNTLTIPVPAGSGNLDRYASRFRYGPTGLGPTGQANDGEVEDHFLIPAAVSVNGQVLFDTNNNAQFDTALDEAVPRVRVFIDQNLNGVRDPSEPNTLTGLDGSYTLQTIAPADGQVVPITIRVDVNSLPAGTEFLNPADGIVSELVSRNPGAEPNNTVTANFLTGPEVREVQTITGSVLLDADEALGVDPSAQGVPGITVRLLTNLDADPALEEVATTVTNSDGVYNFEIANTGDYEVEIDLPANADFELTTPDPNGADNGRLTQTLTIGQDATLSPFGVFDRRATFVSDFGDLPSSYNPNGQPSHTVAGPGTLFPVFLGQTVDADSGSLASPGADADDLNFTDDEDGVSLATLTLPVDNGGGSVTPGLLELDVVATGRVDSVLNIWVDLDGSGVFEADEHLVQDLDIPNAGETTRVVRAITDAGIIGQPTIAVRARYGEAGVGVIGAAGDGEVEDHIFPTAPPSSVVAPSFGAPSSTVNATPAPPAALIGVAPPQLAAVLDESHAVEQADTPVAGSSLDSALLEWSLEPGLREESEAVESAAADDESDAEQSAADLALAEAFAL